MATDPVIVTTSWDDGHHHDVRMAELLTRHGLKGTVYVAFNEPSEPQISKDEIRTLDDMGVEIGSHTLSHRLLTEIPQGEVPAELIESKKRLDDILGHPIEAISYPLGYHNDLVLRTWREAGYRLGRTTKAFQTGMSFEPALMPITVEFFRRSRVAIARHAARDINASGLLRWAAAGFSSEPLYLARHFFDRVAANGGIFHLTARSWEIEEFGLWSELEDLFRHIGSHSEIEALTNIGVLDRVGT